MREQLQYPPKFHLQVWRIKEEGGVEKERGWKQHNTRSIGEGRLPGTKVGQIRSGQRIWQSKGRIINMVGGRGKRGVSMYISCIFLFIRYYIHNCTHIRVYTHIHINICMYVYVCIYLYVRMYVWI